VYRATHLNGILIVNEYLSNVRVLQLIVLREQDV